MCLWFVVHPAPPTQARSGVCHHHTRFSSWVMLVQIGAEWVPRDPMAPARPPDTGGGPPRWLGDHRSIYATPSSFAPRLRATPAPSCPSGWTSKELEDQLERRRYDAELGDQQLEISITARDDDSGTDAEVVLELKIVNAVPAVRRELAAMAGAVAALLLLQNALSLRRCISKSVCAVRFLCSYILAQAGRFDFPRGKRI